MNAASRADQPSDGTVPSYSASRRTFLKGVGLAGAAGLAVPLLARTSAGAATAPIVLGCLAPGPWETTDYGGYLDPTTQATLTWPKLVKGAIGCRSYRDHPFSTVTESQHPDALGNPPKFPGVLHNVAATKVVASIKPDPDIFLNTTDLDYVIMKFIEDGRDNTQLLAPQLTAWHEAGHLYYGSAWSGYHLDPLDDVNGFPTNAAAAQRVRSMHVKMQGLCRQVGGVEYGCIIYGDIDKMANDSDLGGPTNWVPKSKNDGGIALDWYGIDVYYEADQAPTGHNFSDCTHNLPWPGFLSDRSLVSGYLDPFLRMAQNRTGYATTGVQPKINICECNASEANFAARPGFFGNLAYWLHSNGLHRMLTFFPYGGGTHSVQWPPIQGTIDALVNIQATYGS